MRILENLRAKEQHPGFDSHNQHADIATTLVKLWAAPSVRTSSIFCDDKLMEAMLVTFTLSWVGAVKSTERDETVEGK